MAILAAMQSAAIRLMGRRPTAFFGATALFELEITDLVNEVARDVAASHDWQALTKVNSFTGNGSTADFAMPQDYERMLLKSDVQDLLTSTWGYQHVTDINDFMYRKAHGFGGVPGGWIIYGGSVKFWPAPLSGASASFPYISKNFAIDAGSSVAKPQFDNDADEWLLPERLLTLGLVWRWRENKKLDFTGDQEAFIKAISEYTAKDRGSSIYRSNSRRFVRGTYPAWPGVLGP